MTSRFVPGFEPMFMPDEKRVRELVGDDVLREAVKTIVPGKRRLGHASK